MHDIKAFRVRNFDWLACSDKYGFKYHLSLVMNNLGASEFLWLPYASHIATDVASIILIFRV